MFSKCKDIEQKFEQVFCDVIKINFPKTRKKTYLTDETGLV
ncbi:hypothetical protein EUBHAL_01277 [Anaerobutyricum hallii DSM 3353]|uniref:Uncharacterized protein n=1 Tax=Anaerobutyricum hallii DSM 3353 TaxID=411469 RepID=C0EV39_9FIRM|nr:hypothetical protein EUBHAL_01277 [Anaerobutyricum hallii DSM 3353]